MALPPVYREPAPALPSIRSAASDRFRTYSDVPFGTSPAQNIPGMPSHNDAPPPLPPPRFLPFGDAPHLDEVRRSEKDHPRHGFPSTSANSGYESMGSYLEERPFMKRRDTSSTIGGDEGYASYPSTERSRDSLPTEFGFSHSSFQFQSPADLQVDSMKKKLETGRSLDSRSPRPLALSLSANDSWTRGPRLDTRLQQNLSLPMSGVSRSLLDSPRWTETPQYSAVSPRSFPFPHSPREQRSPRDGSDVDRSPQMRTRRNNSDDATSTQGSYDGHADDMEIDDNSSLKRLRIDDAHASQKRRAPSPREDEIMSNGVGSHLEFVKRQDLGNRGPPPARMTASSFEPPPMSSLGFSRSSSLVPATSGPVPTSVPQPMSTVPRSPDGSSQGGVSPTSTQSVYSSTMSADPNRRPHAGVRGAGHTRNGSALSPRKLPEAQQPGGPKIKGFYMCECCPKKPKKFETEEELQAHEAEKQYGCNYCGNRFKNKNEAERHQNSLHVRRHSWSCSALSGYDKAFHESTAHPGEADTCGYCGVDFGRSGQGPGNGALNGGVVPRYATEQDLEERNRHLQEMHKFRECNSSKKFYRADHFRQHLKHSHAGTSGKWTNMLENACMLDEEPPAPRR